MKGVSFVPKNYLPILVTGNTTGFVVDIGINRVLIVSIAFGVVDTFHEGCTFVVRLSFRYSHSI